MSIFGCIGKTIFSSFEEANGVARRQGRNDRLKGRQAYRCKTCRQFHIGTAQRNKRLARTRMVEAFT